MALVLELRWLRKGRDRSSLGVWKVIDTLHRVRMGHIKFALMIRFHPNVESATYRSMACGHEIV